MNGAQGGAAAVCIVGVAWQAPAWRLAPFLPTALDPQKPAGADSSAPLIRAALDDAEAALPPPAARIYFVGDAAAATELSSALGSRRGGQSHVALADALRAAATDLETGAEHACLVGAASSGSAQAAWLVLESADSAAARGAAAYAEIIRLAPTADAAMEAGEGGGCAVGWLELPGGAADAAAAEQCFAIAPLLLRAALRHAEAAPAPGAEKAVEDALALVRAALALGHRILPLLQPAKVGAPDPWTAQPQPWIQPLPHPGWATSGAPRCAGWLAAAADGTPAAMLLREQLAAAERPAAVPFAQQLFVFAADSIPALADQLLALHRNLDPRACESASALAEWAQAWHRPWPSRSAHRLALVVSSLGELRQQLAETAGCLTAASPVDLRSLHQPGVGRYYSAGTTAKELGTTAFLFPGLGASYVGMLGDLCLHFPAVRAVFDSIDFIAAALGEATVPSQQVFPLPGAALDAKLSGAAVVTLLMAEWALAELLREFGIVPEVLMGCSTGEFAALCQAGAIDAVAAVPIFYRLSLGVERSLPPEQLAALQSVLVTAAAGSLGALLEAAPAALHVSAELGPDCALLVGEQQAVSWLLKRLDALGIAAHVLAAGVPYHTPLLRDTTVSSAHELREMRVCAPRLPVWSCATAGTYAALPEKILADASALFVRPIALGATVEAMYQSGVRTFIEVGPGDGLGRRVAAILRGRAHAALASNVPQRSGVAQLLHLLAALHVQGHRIDLAPLFRRCPPQRSPSPVPRSAHRAQTPYPSGSNARVRPLDRTGTLLPALTLDLPHSAHWLCLRVDGKELSAADAWNPQILEKIFSPRELHSGSLALDPESLLRQVAAKRSIQELVRLRLRARVELCELELRPGTSGELHATGGPLHLLGAAPVVAVAGCADAAVALVAPAAPTFRIGMVINRAQSAHITDAQTALCRALAGDSSLLPESGQIAAADEGSGWIALRTPPSNALLHARSFRLGSYVITRAVVPVSL